MRRCMVVAMAVILAACGGSDAPTEQAAPRTWLDGNTTPCAAPIREDIQDSYVELGDPISQDTTIAGDTTTIKVTWHAPPPLESLGTVWRKYWWVFGADYCISEHSEGL